MITLQRGHYRDDDGGASRYVFDFKRCTPKEGWAQFDSEQDASYYGNWLNPFLRKHVSYCEGDICIVSCDTDAEFVATVLDLCGWCINRGEKDPAIDGMCDDAIIARFRELGLGEWLH